MAGKHPGRWLYVTACAYKPRIAHDGRHPAVRVCWAVRWARRPCLTRVFEFLSHILLLFRGEGLTLGEPSLLRLPSPAISHKQPAHSV